METLLPSPHHGVGAHTSGSRGVALLAAAALAGTFAAGCGARESTSQAIATPSAAEARSRPALPMIHDASAEQVLSAVREPGAQAVVVNVWATWCAPCRQEFPDLMKLNQRYQDRGLRLVLVSADFDDQLGEARRFLAQQGVEFVTYHKVGDDMQFINALDPKWTGALPATLVYDGHGVLRHFWEGRATFDQMENNVLDVLAAQQASRTKEE